MRLQDKGNRFVVLDKNTDRSKAHQQIEKSSFTAVPTDLTLQHLRQLEIGQ